MITVDSVTGKLVGWLASVVAAVVHHITGSIASTASTAHAHLSASTLVLSSSHGFALDVIQPLRHVLVLVLEGSSLLGSVVGGRRWHARQSEGTRRRGGCDSSGPEPMLKGLLVKGLLVKDLLVKGLLVKVRGLNWGRLAGVRSGGLRSGRLRVLGFANDQMDGLLVGGPELWGANRKDTD